MTPTTQNAPAEVDVERLRDLAEDFDADSRIAGADFKYEARMEADAKRDLLSAAAAELLSLRERVKDWENDNHTLADHNDRLSFQLNTETQAAETLRSDNEALREKASELSRLSAEVERLKTGEQADTHGSLAVAWPRRLVRRRW